MSDVGVRELKERASEILRRVEEEHETVDITRRGKVIARIVPVTAPAIEAKIARVWAEMDELAKEVGKYWVDGVTVEKAINEERRDS